MVRSAALHLALLACGPLLGGQVFAQPNHPPVCRMSEEACGGSLDRRNIEEDNETPCSLYLAESLLEPGKLGVFTSASFTKDAAIGEPEVILPIFDARKNEWSPWMDMVLEASILPQVNAETRYLNDLFVPGLAQMLRCSNAAHRVNVEQDLSQYKVDAAGVHRSNDASFGSFSYFTNALVQAKRSIHPGEELILPCGDDFDEEAEVLDPKISTRVPVDELVSSSAMCLDNLRVQQSTIEGAGRGAFAKRHIGVGEVIAPSPVLHFDRSQMEVVEQALYTDEEKQTLPEPREHGIRYTENVIHQQLMLNYCFGQPDSNVLLLPYAPVVNYINHNDVKKANAYIRWYTVDEDSLIARGAKEMKSKRPMELFATPPLDQEETLMIEFVALRDIWADEEIFLYYGDEYAGVWHNHTKDWEASASSTQNDYVSATDWKSQYLDQPIRTEREQENDCYPQNLQTACYYSAFDVDSGQLEGDRTWRTGVEDNHRSCLRPCRILARSGTGKRTKYTAVVMPMDRYQEPELCGGVPAQGMKVVGLPQDAVNLMDRPYTTDLHQRTAFRHEMGLPPYFYPFAWMAADPNPTGDFIPTPLAPGQMSLIHWKDNGKVVLQNAFRLGLSTSVRETLLEYCEKMGIIDLFRYVTVQDNGLEPGDDAYLDLQGYHWYLQRPEKKWYSNLHWLSPSDEDAHQHYLQALSKSGFDDMLTGIGTFLGLEHLVVFHVTFIAVSQSTVGYVHTDVSDTGVRTFNIICPLIKATDSSPELDLQENEEPYRLGRYGYELDVAGLMGDDSWHGTSAVDYRMAKEMRLAATIYIAEVTEENVDSIMADYTQEYPPRDHDLLMSWAGRHWRRDDQSAKLPLLSQDHILLKPFISEAR